jgi:predicted LPLAT superfamily acyltransferase
MTGEAKSPAPAVRASWAFQSERGSRFMLQLMTWISLRLGRRAGRVILYLIAAYFTLFAPCATAASRDYLRRVLDRAPRRRDVFRHILTFASTIHDRVYLINDQFQAFDIQIIGDAVIRRVENQGQGCIIIGAHLGSFDIIRALGDHRQASQVTVLMYEDNARKINSMLAAINPGKQQDIIALGRIDSILQVRDRLDHGAVVGVLADRGLDDDATATVTFLGQPAAFPIGPFRMAAMLACPVVFMAGIYAGGNRYEIHFEDVVDFSLTAPADRGVAINAALTRYVALVEQHCRSHPYNWFNFYDFWRVRASSPS